MSPKLPTLGRRATKYYSNNESIPKCDYEIIDCIDSKLFFLHGGDARPDLVIELRLKTIVGMTRTLLCCYYEIFPLPVAVIPVCIIIITRSDRNTGELRPNVIFVIIF